MIFWLSRQLTNLAVAAVAALAIYTHRDDILAYLDGGARGPAAASAGRAIPGPAPPSQPPSHLAPAKAVPGKTSPSRTMRIRADRDGHFTVVATVDGTAVRFLIDTGATTVVLTPEDAARIGLRPRDRDFTETFRTAVGSSVPRQ